MPNVFVNAASRSMLASPADGFVAPMSSNSQSSATRIIVALYDFGTIVMPIILLAKTAASATLWAGLHVNGT